MKFVILSVCIIHIQIINCFYKAHISQSTYYYYCWSVGYNDYIPETMSIPWGVYSLCCKAHKGLSSTNLSHLNPHKYRQAYTHLLLGEEKHLAHGRKHHYSMAGLEPTLCKMPTRSSVRRTRLLDHSTPHLTLHVSSFQSQRRHKLKLLFQF